MEYYIDSTKTCHNLIPAESGWVPPGLQGNMRPQSAPNGFGIWPLDASKAQDAPARFSKSLYIVLNTPHLAPQTAPWALGWLVWPGLTGIVKLARLPILCDVDEVSAPL